MEIVRIMNLGSHVNMDSYMWNTVRRLLESSGHTVIEDAPSKTGFSTRRVYKTPPGPKKRQTAARPLSKIR